MANTLSKISVKLTTDSKDMTEGLKKGGKEVLTWSQKLKKDLTTSNWSTIKGGIAGGIASALTPSGVGGVLGAGIGGLIGALIPGGTLIGAALGGAVGHGLEAGITSSLNIFKDLRNEIDDLNDAAQSLDMNRQEFEGLAYGAKLSGVGVDDLKIALKKLAESGMDIYEFSDEFQKLGREDQFKALASLGRAGYKLGPIFREGTASLRALVEEGKQFSIPDGAADSVANANDAIDRASAAISYLKKMVVVSLAPSFEFLANLVFELSKEFRGVGITGESMRDTLIDVFKFVAQAAATAWDVLKIGPAVMSIAVGGIIKMLGWLVDAFKELIDLGKALPKEMRPDWVDDISSATNRMSQQIHKAGEGLIGWGAKSLGNFGQSAKDVGSFFDRVRGMAKKSGKDAGKDFAESVNQQVASIKWEPLKGIDRHTKEAVQVENRYAFQNMTGLKFQDGDTNKQILKEEKEQNKNLGKIQKLLKNKDRGDDSF